MSMLAWEAYDAAMRWQKEHEPKLINLSTMSINKAAHYRVKDIITKGGQKKTTKHDVIASQRAIIDQAIAIVSTFVITDVCYSASSKQFKEGVKRFSKLLEGYEI